MSKCPTRLRPTANIEWNADRRVKEDSPLYAGSNKKDPTLNAQRSTSNAQGQRETRFDLEEPLLEFSARIIRLVDALPNTRAANHVAGQLLRCGTSPYGNHGEVEAAESRKDFIHKLRICLKELKESRRWLRLLEKAAMPSATRMSPILRETETYQNFLRQHSDGGKKRKMNMRFSEFSVERWTLSVGRLLQQSVTP